MFVEQFLTSTSTTPRTARKYLDELVRLSQQSADARPSLPVCVEDTTVDVLYTEGKIALGQGDTHAARALFNECPPDYRNVAQYQSHMSTYDRLCESGVIGGTKRLSADAIDEVRMWLVEVLQESDANASDMRSYASRLHHQGYSRASLRLLTLRDVSTLAHHAEMADGHRRLIERHVATMASPCERVVMTIVAYAEQCSGVAQCVSAMVHTPYEDTAKQSADTPYHA